MISTHTHKDIHSDDTETNTYAIQTIHLSKRFAGGHGVHGLNLTVPEQAIYGFLGPNGAGKTTTIRMLLSLIAPDDGEVFLFGERLLQHSRYALRYVGALVESPSLYGHLTGAENLEVTRRLLALPKVRIAEVLRLVDLHDAANRLVREYSLGMRQRLALALALLSEPRLLILDEPSNGLDPAGIQEFRQLLRSLVKDRGLTVFLSSHLLSEIEIMATHVGVLQAGQLLFEGVLDELRQRIKPALEIRCSDIEQAMTLLETIGESDYKKQGELLVVQLRLLSIAEINHHLVQSNVAVSELTLRTASLETLFFNLTKNTNEVIHD
jgi:lantibiotic transport system ATP-binding protein